MPRARAQHIDVRWPDLYIDWELFKPHTIRWDTYNSINHATPVRIDLYQDSPTGLQFLLNITPATPDTASFQWIPANSGLTYGTYGLRIQVSFVGDNSVIDRAAEPFTIPEDGDSLLRGRRSNANDEYSTAVGSNRNDRQAGHRPQAQPVNVLRVYDLTSGSTLNVDTGPYPLIYTAVATSQGGRRPGRRPRLRLCRAQPTPRRTPS